MDLKTLRLESDVIFPAPALRLQGGSLGVAPVKTTVGADGVLYVGAISPTPRTLVVLSAFGARMPVFHIARG